MVWTHDVGNKMSYPCNGLDFTEYYQKCQNKYNATPTADAAKIMYGEDKFNQATNIIFRYYQPKTET